MNNRRKLQPATREIGVAGRSNVEELPAKFVLCCWRKQTMMTKAETDLPQISPPELSSSGRKEFCPQGLSFRQAFFETIFEIKNMVLNKASISLLPYTFFHN
jgi:hypothetical protein